MCSSPAVEDLSIQGKLSSNSFGVVMVYMLYVKDHPGFIVKLADQKPKQTETHSSTFPQDSDSESEIELRSSQSSPDETTSEESDGTLVDTSTPSSPTQPLSGEGDLDPTEGHSQLSVGTLPLTDKDPPKGPEGKDPPKDPPKDPEDKSPPQDQPETLIDPGEHPIKPPLKRSQKNSVADPFSRFWSGETADVTDKDKKRHRWLTRKSKRRHSDGLGIIDGQNERPYKYVLEGERDLLPRPRFYSKCPDTSSISLEYVGFILRYLVQQRNQELEQEKLDKEMKEEL